MEKIEDLDKNELLALQEQVGEALTRLGCPARGNGHGPVSEHVHACRLFTVSEGVRQLDKRQIEQLTESFKGWVNASRNDRTRRSRERVFLVYLVLRYTGARLGEVLALDERGDIDFMRSVVMIPDGAEVREVPLPEEVITRIKAYCAKYEAVLPDPAGPHRERLFDLDPGFLRRKFYEQEERCGLPRDLLNPRVLRNSRAIELLQGGMPMRAVQALMGHTKADFTAAYVNLAQEDLQHIIRHYCLKEFGMETSARNTFQGEVIDVTANPVLTEITLRTPSGYEIVAVITNKSREKLGLVVGRQAQAMIKATWVILEKAKEPTPSSARNAFPGVVTEIVSDDVAAEVRGELSDGTPVCALITAGSLEKLGIGEGDSFSFMFKAMSVIVS